MAASGKKYPFDPLSMKLSLRVCELNVVVKKPADVPEVLIGKMDTEPSELFDSVPIPKIMEPLSVGPRLPGWEPLVSLEQGFRLLLDEAGIVDAESEVSPP